MLSVAAGALEPASRDASAAQNRFVGKVRCPKPKLLIKDSFTKAYPEEIMDLFTNNEDDTGSAYSATELDEFVL